MSWEEAGYVWSIGKKFEACGGGFDSSGRVVLEDCLEVLDQLELNSTLSGSQLSLPSVGRVNGRLPLLVSHLNLPNDLLQIQVPAG